MKFVILIALVAGALAVPKPDYPAPKARSEDRDEVPILRHDLVMDDDGKYNLDVETGNGITYSVSESPTGPEESVVKAGEYSYIAPDGTDVHVKFVADENGYQPQSDLLPVAPEFPHPIPQFVLDQIEKAAREDAARARGDLSSEEYSRPSSSYRAP